MKRSACWYKAERPQKKTSCIVQPELTFRVVALETNAKTGANRTGALVSVHWSSQSLHPKQPLNQISHKSTTVDPIRLSGTWKKSYPISQSFSFQHIKIFLPRNARSTNAHDRVISGVVTPKDKAKSKSRC